MQSRRECSNIPGGTAWLESACPPLPLNRARGNAPNSTASILFKFQPFTDTRASVKAGVSLALCRNPADTFRRLMKFKPETDLKTVLIISATLPLSTVPSSPTTVSAGTRRVNASTLSGVTPFFTASTVTMPANAAACAFACSWESWFCASATRVFASFCVRYRLLCPLLCFLLLAGHPLLLLDCVQACSCGTGSTPCSCPRYRLSSIRETTGWGSVTVFACRRCFLSMSILHSENRHKVLPIWWRFVSAFAPRKSSCPPQARTP